MSDSPSEDFRTGPNTSAPFGSARNASASFGMLPQKERTEQHTLSVKEVARLFEDAGVARTERTLINWCRSNPQGQSKLDCYHDTNEHKWLITLQSVTLAIAEEQDRKGEGEPHPSAPVGTLRKASEDGQDAAKRATEDTENKPRVAELEKQNLQLQADKEGRDRVISSLQDTLTRQSEIFARRIAQVSEQAGEYKAKFAIVNERLLQLNDGPVEVKKEEQEEPGRVGHPAPAPAIAHTPERPGTTRIHVVNQNNTEENTTTPEEEGRAGDAPPQT